MSASGFWKASSPRGLFCSGEPYLPFPISHIPFAIRALREFVLVGLLGQPQPCLMCGLTMVLDGMSKSKTEDQVAMKKRQNEVGCLVATLLHKSPTLDFLKPCRIVSFVFNVSRFRKPLRGFFSNWSGRQ